jgi:ribosomal protection tetracycline resistance protein
MENTINEYKKALNIGIFAHVDAGKTTITEQLLYKSGVIDNFGRVDHGDTVTDSMSQEKKRGITIQAQPVSFPIDDIKVNLIDTPGHVDFVAEVERSMSVLDGAILVLSAKEGVQAHTYLLFNSLKKLNIPFIIFINKIDRPGSDNDEVISEIKKSLSRNVLSMQDVYNVGSKDSSVSKLFHSDLMKNIDLLTEYDEALLDNYVNEMPICNAMLKSSIINLCQIGVLNPIISGSALSGCGISELLNGIKDFLPSSKLDTKGLTSFRVFKIKRNSKDLKQYYIKVESGKVTVRDSVLNEKINKIEILKNGKEIPATNILSGDIGIIYGVNLKVGSIIGEFNFDEGVSLGTPTYKSGIRAIKSEQKQYLLDCITKISESDPFLEYEQSPINGEVYLNFFGKVQMEIVKDILFESYGIEVKLSEPSVIYKETPIFSGESFIEMLGHLNPYPATLGLKINPGDLGSGIVIKSDVRVGDVSLSMWNSIHDGIYSALRQGLSGWSVTDIVVTISKVKFIASTTPADFRDMTPMVVLEALNRANTKLLWPLLHFDLRVPEKLYGRAVSDLFRMKAQFDDPNLSDEMVTIRGSIPVETSRDYVLELTDYTSGKGVMATSFHSYSDADNSIFSKRKKIYPDPLDKEQYLMGKRGRI